MNKLNNNNFVIKDVIEKPSVQKSPSNYAVIGRYLLSKKIFNVLPEISKGKSGEYHITDAIKQMINNDENFIGHIFKGKYLDCGTMQGYTDSTQEISKL